MKWVIEDVQRLKTIQLLLKPVQACVTEFQLLRPVDSSLERGFDSAEGQLLNVGSSPDIGRTTTDIIDHVVLTPVERGYFSLQVRTHIPIEPRLEVCSRFGQKARRAHGRGVVI